MSVRGIRQGSDPGMRQALQPLALEAHAGVAPDGARVVLAHDVGEPRADEGHECAAGLGRGHRALLVERRAVVLGPIAVRLGHRGDAAGGARLGQALLVGGEHALAPSAGFG